MFKMRILYAYQFVPVPFLYLIYYNLHYYAHLESTSSPDKYSFETDATIFFKGGRGSFAKKNYELYKYNFRYRYWFNYC